MMDIKPDLDSQLGRIRSKLRMILLNLARLTGTGTSTECDNVHNKDKDNAFKEEVLGKVSEETKVIVTITEKPDNSGSDQSSTNMYKSTDNVLTSSAFEDSKASANFVTNTTNDVSKCYNVRAPDNSGDDSNTDIEGMRVDLVAAESSDSDSDDTSDESDEDYTEEIEYTDDNENIVEEGYEIPTRKPLRIIPVQRLYAVQGDLRTTVLMTEARKRLWHTSEI